MRIRTARVMPGVLIPPRTDGGTHLGHAFNNTIRTSSSAITGWAGRGPSGCRARSRRSPPSPWSRSDSPAGEERTDFSREAFVEQVQAWKDEYEATILGQLEEMGCSDSSLTRFTMDPVCADAVREFFQLFRDGLIYRGKCWSTGIL